MQVRPFFRAALTAVWAIFALGSMAAAQGSAITLGVQDHDSTIPVEITSEELSLDQDKGTADFVGNVIVRQGDVTMTCQKMVVIYGKTEGSEKTEIQEIRLNGNVTFVSSTEAAEANSAVYSLVNRVIDMKGDVLVTQGPTALSADRLIYDLATGNGRMQGNVKTVLQQGNN